MTGWPLGVGLIGLAVVVQQTGWRYMRRRQQDRRQLHTEAGRDESQALLALVRSSQLPTKVQEMFVLTTMVASGIIGAIGLTRF